MVKRMDRPSTHCPSCGKRAAIIFEEHRIKGELRGGVITCSECSAAWRVPHFTRYPFGPPTCRFCGHEMTATEAMDGDDVPESLKGKTLFCFRCGKINEGDAERHDDDSRMSCGSILVLVIHISVIALLLYYCCH
jgi:transcription elongation factor Elf1